MEGLRGVAVWIAASLAAVFVVAALDTGSVTAAWLGLGRLLFGVLVLAALAAVVGAVVALVQRSH